MAMNRPAGEPSGDEPPDFPEEPSSDPEAKGLLPDKPEPGPSPQPVGPTNPEEEEAKARLREELLALADKFSQEEFDRLKEEIYNMLAEMFSQIKKVRATDLDPELKDAAAQASRQKYEKAKKERLEKALSARPPVPTPVQTPVPTPVPTPVQTPVQTPVPTPVPHTEPAQHEETKQEPGDPTRRDEDTQHVNLHDVEPESLAEEAKRKLAREMLDLAHDFNEIEFEKMKKHEEGMVTLMARQIEIATASEATKEAQEAIAKAIHEKYEKEKKQRLGKAWSLAQFTVNADQTQAVRTAAEIARLKEIIGDIGEIKKMGMNIDEIEREKKKRERELALERQAAIRATADLTILQQRLDSRMMIIQKIKKPDNIPSCGECCSCSNCGDTKFLSLCSLLWCPYPGLCMVQNYLMKGLHIERENAAGRKCDLCYDNVGFAGLGLVTCCLGLALNRERITDQTVDRKGNFCWNLCVFMCCMGWCLMMRDEMFTFPIKPRVNKKFKESCFACCNLKRMKRAWNCLGCCSAVCCPFPCVCLVQACTVVETEEVIRSVTINPLENSAEKRSLLMRHFLIGCLGCCIGLALNRSKIAGDIGIDEHCGCDCLWYMCCFQCMAVQECYSINEMRSASD